MGSADGSKARGLDDVAARAALARLARRESTPWLHAEIARRLIERLAPLRAEPTRIVEWWAGPGDGDALLRERYPRAERIAVEPEGAWTERRRATEHRPWWSIGGRAPATVWPDSADDVAIGRAQLVWANMVLPFVVDPPALMARWHTVLEVEGVVAFSCLGPDTLREMRALYASLGWPTPTPTFIDMHDLGDMLVGAGFADPVLDQETLTLRWKNAEALLAELRQLGGNTSPARFAGLRTAALAPTPARRTGRARRQRRQHRSQRRGRLRPRLQAITARRRRRPGGRLARRDARHGATAAFFALKPYAKILGFVGADSAFDGLRSPLAVAFNAAQPPIPGDDSQMSALSVQAFGGLPPSPASLRFGRADLGDGSVQWLLRRNCSMTPTQLLAFYLSLSAWSLAIAGAFWWRGATLVLPFAGVEILAVGAALWVYARHAADRERLTLEPGRLTVECTIGLRTDQAAFAPGWLRIEPEHGDRSLIELTGQGQRIAVGRFVRPEQRRALADELRAALGRCGAVRRHPDGAVSAATANPPTTN